MTSSRARATASRRLRWRAPYFAVKATIVLEKGYEGTPELIKELQVWTREQTAPYKYPRVLEFVDALPQTFSGKIRRAEIRQRDLAKANA